MFIVPPDRELDIIRLCPVIFGKRAHFSSGTAKSTGSFRQNAENIGVYIHTQLSIDNHYM